MIEKTNKRVIGLDIGGSHITSGVIDLGRNTIFDKTLFTSPVNNKDSKDSILKIWADTILKSVDSCQGAEISGIAFAMPGPFEYHTGKALFERNDKHEGLETSALIGCAQLFDPVFFKSIEGWLSEL